MYLNTVQQTLETVLLDRGMEPGRISGILTFLEAPEALEEMLEWLRDNETEPASEAMLEAIILWDKYNDGFDDEADYMDCA
ncbi:MAG: hypothetical protein J5569_00810 [Oscillospiraceae bacterium]|nr:hypothetical protein [Oscillospiraceae bacterium]